MNDSTHKFVAVLNKKVETGRLMNALAHMSAGFSAMYPEKGELKFDNYFDKDGGMHPSLSDNPFIILSADNSNQIRTFRNALKENNILFNDFTSTMVEEPHKNKRNGRVKHLSWNLNTGESVLLEK